MKDVILTGLRANERLHIGNYLGAILPMANLQKKYAGAYQMNMFIPDLHSFTTPIDHGKLYQNSIDNVKVFVAAGIDINNPDTYIYRQSYIPAHSELTWILDCFTGVGEIERMTEFKDKSVRVGTDRVTAGLFNYPVLMAADILLYNAKYIPVGEDQRQHLEFARDIALRMNNKFGELFTVPEPTTKQVEFSGRSNPVRIRSLRSPDKKMSKSIEDPAGTILLKDSLEEATKKVMGATTDSVGVINFDIKKQPGITNLLQILALLTNKLQTEVNNQWKGKSNYGELKSAVSEAVGGFLADFQGKYTQVDESALIAKLEASEKAMNKVANQTLAKVQKVVGLRP